MTDTVLERLAQLRRHLHVVHHVPGRLRLRIGAGLAGAADGLAGLRLDRALRSAPGIREVRVNSLAASVVVEYDTQQWPPALWDDLLHGPGDVAAAAVRDLLAKLD